MPDQTDNGPGDDEAVKTAPQLSPKLRKQADVDEDSKPEAEPTKSKKSAAEAETQAEFASKTGTGTSSEPARADDPIEQSADLDDARTDEAVKDIVSYEGDVMLAVADSTAEARNREAGVSEDEDEGGGRRWLSAIIWTLVIFIVIVAVVFFALLVTGGNVTGLKQVPGLSN
ncbi:MAG: hypothetical protein ACREJM_01320 [Candidatus Saccharimonadales bacterium]